MSGAQVGMFEVYDKNVEVSEGDYRYSLYRAWNAALPVLPWIMCNPSNASAVRDDPTWTSVIQRSGDMGYGACVGLNVSPYRTSSPKVLLERHRAGVDIIDRRRNYGEIEKWLRLVDPSRNEVVVAWGKLHPEIVGWVDELMAKVLYRVGVPMVSLGVNSDGSPRHPLSRGRARIPRWTKSRPWAPPQRPLEEIRS